MISLNGFLMLGGDDIMHHSYLQFTGEQQRFIVVYHDPVDWMLAFWNFWTQRNDDMELNAPRMWVKKGNSNWSPEKFHELFSAGPIRQNIFHIFLVLFELFLSELLVLAIFVNYRCMWGRRRIMCYC